MVDSIEDTIPENASLARVGEVLSITQPLIVERTYRQSASGILQQSDHMFGKILGLLLAAACLFFLIKFFGPKKTSKSEPTEDLSPPQPDSMPTEDGATDDVNANAANEGPGDISFALDEPVVSSPTILDAVDIPSESVALDSDEEDEPETIEVLDDESSVADKSSPDVERPVVETGEPIELEMDELPPRDSAPESPTAPSPLPPPKLPGRRETLVPPRQPDTRLAGSSIPPRKFAVGQAPPPRRAEPPTSPDSPFPPASTSFASSASEPMDEAKTNERATIPIGDSPEANLDVDLGELDELRLALDASHNELSHLTSQRDQAVSRATRNEEELGRLRHQLHELSAVQEGIQKERERAHRLETELTAMRDAVNESRAEANAVEEDQAQKSATIDELRMLLAEREAMEASLSRERDNLTAQNEDLKRRLEQSDSTEPEVDRSAVQQLAILQQEHQQVGADLSLANETVRQLNQNITQRDAQLASLRQQVNDIAGELEKAHADAAQHAEQHSAEQENRLEALQNDVAQRDATIQEITARHAELESQVSELTEAVKANQPNDEMAGELSLANESVRQLTQNITQRDAQLAGLRQQVEELTRQLDESRAEVAKPNAEQSAQVETLQNEIEQRDATIQEMTSHRAELEARVDELSAAEAAASSQPDPALAGELSLANETIRQLNQNITQRDAQLHNLRQEMHALAEQQEEAAAAGPDESVLQEIEQQHEATLAELRQMLADRDAVIEEQTSQRELLESQISQLKAEASSKPDVDQSEMSLASETIRQLNQTLLQRDSELIDLRRGLRTNEETGTELERLRKDLEQAQNTCAELEADRHREKNEYSSAKENLHEELATARQGQETLTEELTVVKNQVGEQALVIEKLRDERTDLQQRIASASSDAPDPATIERISAERDEIREQFEKLKVDFAHAVKPNDADAEELSTLQTKLATKSADFDALRAEHHTVKARYESEIGALKSRLESLRSEDKDRDVTEDVEGATDTAASDATESQVSSDRISALEATIAQHEEYAAGLQTERQDLLDKLGASQEEINAKAAEMRRMREELKQAQEVAARGNEQQEAFAKLQETERDLNELVSGRNTELKRLQEEQIELKQQVAHYIDAEEEWQSERVALLAQAGFDEDGEPLAGGNASGEQADQIARLESRLAERDEAIQSLTTRFDELKQLYDSATDRGSVLEDDAADPMDNLRAERDQAAAAAAESSAKIAELMSELHAIKSNKNEDSAKVQELEEQNREYRISVAELHASLNELEELKLERIREQETARGRLKEATKANADLVAEIEALKQAVANNSTPDGETAVNAIGPAGQQELDELKKQLAQFKRERSEQQKRIALLQEEFDEIPENLKVGAKAVRDAKRLNAKVTSQEKKLQTRDDRLQELAVELGKLRAEAKLLRNELAEQQAVVRALNKGQPLVKSSASRTDQNGRPAKKVATKESEAKKTTKKRSKTKKLAAKKSQAPQRTTRSKAKKLSTAKKVDDLKQITGVGPVLEKRLNEHGIFRFDQVKGWNKSTIEKIDDELGLGGRIQRDKWVAQAKKLAKKK